MPVFIYMYDFSCICHLYIYIFSVCIVFGVHLPSIYILLPSFLSLSSPCMSLRMNVLACICHPFMSMLPQHVCPLCMYVFGFFFICMSPLCIRLFDIPSWIYFSRAYVLPYIYPLCIYVFSICIILCMIIVGIQTPQTIS